MSKETGALCVKHLSDEELITRLAIGDSRAMDVLVSRYHGKLLDFVLRQIGNRETSADIAQAAFVKAFESAPGFDAKKASFKTWLYTITLNLVREEFRRRLRSRETPILDLDEQAETTGSAETQALEKVFSTDLWKQVSRLREEHRVALVLRFRQGLSYDEIAEVMSAPSGTVKSWVHYALASLKKLLVPQNCES
jgi:RNA polymerase sigma-70 factor, ECF subfamily